MLEELTAKEKVVGLKQTRRAVLEGNAEKVFVACDAESRLSAPLLALCESTGIEAESCWSKKQLGCACGIDVSTAAAAILAKKEVSPE